MSDLPPELSREEIFALMDKGQKFFMVKCCEWDEYCERHVSEITLDNIFNPHTKISTTDTKTLSRIRKIKSYKKIDRLSMIG